jgi:hypothetical protein
VVKTWRQEDALENSATARGIANHWTLDIGFWGPPRIVLSVVVHAARPRTH